VKKERKKSVKNEVIEEQQLKFIEKHVNRLTIAKLRKEFSVQLE